MTIKEFYEWARENNVESEKVLLTEPGGILFEEYDINPKILTKKNGDKVVTIYKKLIK